MNVLLDECLPRKLKHDLPSHKVLLVLPTVKPGDLIHVTL